jgi:hypothetical protein
MVIAAQCVPVNSSWVHQFVLTCDNELAVQFENGVCCLYPGTTKPLFELALVWGSPGKFVHAFLYKKIAYRLIKPPCPAQDCAGVMTGCCPAPIPTTLHATVTGGGACDGSYALVYDSGFGKWVYQGGFGILCIAGQDNIALGCTGAGAWQLGTPGGIVTQPGFSCTPFLITFTPFDLRICGGANGATITVTT